MLIYDQTFAGWVLWSLHLPFGRVTPLRPESGCLPFKEIVLQTRVHHPARVSVVRVSALELTRAKSCLPR